MSNFQSIISDYMEHTINLNDRRIIKEALNIIDSESIILDEELDILNEFFISLKNDYTLNIIQDPTNLDFCIAIIKQPLPIIRNSHDLDGLLNELKINSKNKQINKIETVVLNFLNASEHVEENEILLIQNIIRYINNDWILKPLEKIKYSGEEINISRLVPTYCKKLIKTN